MPQLRWMAIWFVAAISTFGFAADAAPGIDWPSDKPVLHFDIAQYTKTGSYQNRNVYNLDIVVKNVSNTKISNSSFHLYLLNKLKARISDNSIYVNNLQPGETLKRLIIVQAAGLPSEFAVDPEQLSDELSYLAPSKLIATTIDSVPSGAQLSVDGSPAGTTPVEVKLTVGTHKLSLEKEGFTRGSFPITIRADQLGGGTATFELGGAQHDSVELRDGTMVTGHIQSMDEAEIVMDTPAGVQKYSRDTIKRISLVEKQAPPTPAN
jgi:PEGA domain-containing protein